MNEPRKGMKSRWSIKRKRKINCSHPRGFSQKNYCKRQKRGGSYLEGFREWLFREERENINGWLGPRGKFYRCGDFGHSSLAMRDPELKIHLTDENIKLAQESGDVEVLYWDLWKAGFLRVAGFSSGIIYFEGYSNGIRNLYQKAKDLAEENDMKAEFLNKSREFA